MVNRFLDDWAAGILAHPILKCPTAAENFVAINGVLDARVYLKNTYGFNSWERGQKFYEVWEANSVGYSDDVFYYKNEIEYDKPVYEFFKIRGDVIDVGGSSGTLREFLHEDVRYISLDPYIEAPFQIPASKKAAYSCLSKDYNFIGGMAEFLPFRAESFDCVHMRSMLDHVQVPDLALMEARRVLKRDGSLLVGLYVEGGKRGGKTIKDVIKHLVRKALSFIGIKRYIDHHTWHPTYNNLVKIIVENGFAIDRVYWQPHWREQVVYLSAKKELGIQDIL